MDETGITTVQNPENIICEKGEKYIGSITSAEREMVRNGNKWHALLMPRGKPFQPCLYFLDYGMVKLLLARLQLDLLIDRPNLDG